MEILNTTTGYKETFYYLDRYNRDMTEDCLKGDDFDVVVEYDEELNLWKLDQDAVDWWREHLEKLERIEQFYSEYPKRVTDDLWQACSMGWDFLDEQIAWIEEYEKEQLEKLERIEQFISEHPTREIEGLWQDCSMGWDFFDVDEQIAWIEEYEKEHANDYKHESNLE